MTDTPDTPDVDQSPEIAGRELPGDVFLRVLNQQVAEVEGTEFLLTLTVRGIVVTGKLVGRRTWAQHAVDAYGSDDMMRALFTQIAEDADVDTSYESRDVDFLHLTQTTFMSGGETIPHQHENGFVWRGRIGDVSGWAFGGIRPSLQ